MSFRTTEARDPWERRVPGRHPLHHLIWVHTMWDSNVVLSREACVYIQGVRAHFYVSLLITQVGVFNYLQSFHHASIKTCFQTFNFQNNSITIASDRRIHRWLDALFSTGDNRARCSTLQNHTFWIEDWQKISRCDAAAGRAAPLHGLRPSLLNALSGVRQREAQCSVEVRDDGLPGASLMYVQQVYMRWRHAADRCSNLSNCCTAFRFYP